MFEIKSNEIFAAIREYWPGKDSEVFHELFLFSPKTNLKSLCFYGLYSLLLHPPVSPSVNTYRIANYNEARRADAPTRKALRKGYERLLRLRATPRTLSEHTHLADDSSCRSPKRLCEPLRSCRCTVSRSQEAPEFTLPCFCFFIAERDIMANILLIWLYDYITTAANLTLPRPPFCLSLGRSVIYVFKRKYKSESKGWNELWD